MPVFSQHYLIAYLVFVFSIFAAGKNRAEGRSSLRRQFDNNFSLFYVESPDGTILSHPVEENEKFPVQFGREVSSLIEQLKILSLITLGLNVPEEFLHVLFV